MSILALTFAGSTGFAQIASKTVTFSGSVVDDSGAPIAGAMVHFHNAPATQKNSAGKPYLAEPFVSSHVLTAKDGTFSVTGVPPGFYLLHAAGTSATHLRSCDWRGNSAQLDLKTAASITNVKLQVPDGVLVTFEVNDARNQVKDPPSAPASNGKAQDRGKFRIFVRDGATFFMAPASPVSVNGNARKYRVAVPKTANLRLVLDTALNVTDESKKPLPLRAAATAIAVSGHPVTVQLTVP